MSKAVVGGSLLGEPVGVGGVAGAIHKDQLRAMIQTDGDGGGFARAASVQGWEQLCAKGAGGEGRVDIVAGE